MAIPDGPSAARDTYILDAVKSGNALLEWASLTHTYQGHTGRFRVFADALRVDGVRVEASAQLAQQIADVVGASLLSAQLADLLFAQRGQTIAPETQTPDSLMMSTPRMIQESQSIDAAVAAQGGRKPGILQTVGKHWILRGLGKIPAGRGCNYGWHFLGSTGYAPATSLTGPGVRVWQPPGTVHESSYADYSQTCCLVARDCIVDGQNWDLSALMQDGALCGLVSSEGPLAPRVPLSRRVYPVLTPAPASTPPPVAPSSSSSSSSSSGAAVLAFFGLAGLSLLAVARRTG